MRTLLLALLALAVAPTAYAQPESAYYGLALGSFDYEEGDGAGGEFLSDSVSSYRLMVGYQFMEHLTVEGGYGETGTIRDTASLLIGTPVGPQVIPLEFASEFKILTIRLLGVLPLDNVKLLGGISFSDMKQDIDATLGGQQQSFDIDGNETSLYVGAQYDWDRFAIRLGYEGFDFDGDIDAKETTLSFFNTSR
jgi:hypothetical protein